MWRPSDVIEAPAESPSPWVPSAATLILSTPAPDAMAGAAVAVAGSTAVTAQTATAALRALRPRPLTLRLA